MKVKKHNENDTKEYYLSNGDYLFKADEIFRSKKSSFRLLNYLGKGSFGQVVKCLDIKTNGIVAIKILNNDLAYANQSQIEIDILTRLSLENDNCHLVKTFEFFKHKNHNCLVFEILKINLKDFLIRNGPFDLECIRSILHQLLLALSKLKQIGLIHADLKPENIMIADPDSKKLTVKIIDFGSSAYVSNFNQHLCIQTRFYRAPENLLGLSCSESVDMWSLGCVVAELFLNWPLYPGSSEYDQIRYICQTQGLPSDRLLNMATKTSLFFNRDIGGFSYPFWRLKSQKAYEFETGVKPTENRKYIFNCLDDICQIRFSTILVGENQKIAETKRIAFVSILKEMLQVEQEKRIDPNEALNHNFITHEQLDILAFSKNITKPMHKQTNSNNLKQTDYRIQLQKKLDAYNYHQPNLNISSYSPSFQERNRSSNNLKTKLSFEKKIHELKINHQINF